MEYKPKKRDWVKNAAIIFLTVLLLLTFFSNTWMNRSLPEVATQYVQNGSITAKVRGTGTVTAVGTSTVKAEDTREIRAVMVKVGQKVEAGDVLFVLGQGEASALEAAQEQLRQLEMSYQRTAAGIAYPSYAGDERRIQDAKEEMDAAKAALDRIAAGTSETVDTLMEKQQQISEQLEEAEKVRDAERDAYDTLIAEAKGDLAVKAQERDDAQRALTQKGISVLERWRFQDANRNVVTLSEFGEVLQTTQMFSTMAATVYTEGPEEYGETLPLFDAAAADVTVPDTGAENGIEQTLTEPEPGASTIESTDTISEIQAAASGAEDAVTEPESEAAAAENGTPSDSASSGGVTPEPYVVPTQPAVPEGSVDPADVLLMQDYQKKQQLVDAAQKFLEDIPRANLDAAQAQVDALQGEYDGYQSGIDAAVNASADSETYIKANTAYKAARDSYLSLVETLDEKKRADARSQSLSYIDLTDISQQIENARKKLAELSGGEQNQITAKVAGTVLTVECAPGDTKLKNDVLCTIEVPDMGYTLSFSVTNEQSRRLKVGDTATVSNYYWGREVLATLSNIKTDPKNPQNSKVLTFDLSGDVTPGAELTLSVGQKSANYDIIIPNSAIRSDTNGSFVLRVEAKNSPLGNRYIARRVGVEVLAEDDMNSAVTGDLGYGDYVITTSNAPVKNGDMVRLADNA